MNDTNGSIGADDPVLDIVRHSRVERFPGLAFHSVSVIGVNHCKERWERSGRKLLGLVAQDAVNFVRPYQLVFRDVPGPASDMANALGFRELTFTLPQFFFVTFAPDDNMPRPQ